MKLETLRRYLETLASDGRGQVLLAVSFGWLLTLGVRLVFPPIVPFLVDAFDIEYAVVGLFLTLLWFAYALGQLPGGFLGDRLGERTILTASMSMTIVAVLFTITLPYPFLLFGILALGLATGLYATSRFTILSEIYPDRDGVAIGISASIGHLGSIVLPPLAVFFTIAYGWRAGVGFIVPLALIAVVALWRLLPSSAPSAADTSSTSRLPFRELLAMTRRDLGRKAVVAAAVLMFIFSFIEQGLMAFYPTYLITEKGITETTASVLFGLFFASAVVIQPLVGAVSDRIGTRITIGGVTVITSLSVFTVQFVEGLVLLIVFTGLLGMLFGFWPVAYSYLMAILAEENRNTGVGVIRTWYLLFASTSPLLIGLLVDRDYFNEAFTVLAVMAAIALLITAFLENPTAESSTVE